MKMGWRDHFHFNHPYWNGARENCTQYAPVQAIDWMSQFSSCILKIYFFFHPHSAIKFKWYTAVCGCFVITNQSISAVDVISLAQVCSTSFASYSNIHLHTIKFKILNTREIFFNIKCWFFHFFAYAFIHKKKNKKKKTNKGRTKSSLFHIEIERNSEAFKILCLW